MVEEEMMVSVDGVLLIMVPQVLLSQHYQVTLSPFPSQRRIIKIIFFNLHMMEAQQQQQQQHLNLLHKITSVITSVV
eukprot:3950297-Ditylum_brightwellii.AAC.1